MKDELKELTLSDGQMITMSTKETLLGVNINKDMSWNGHLVTGTESVHRKSNRKLGMIRKICEKMSTSAKLKICNGLIISRLTYAISVWGGGGISNKYIETAESYE